MSEYIRCGNMYAAYADDCDNMQSAILITTFKVFHEYYPAAAAVIYDIDGTIYNLAKSGKNKYVWSESRAPNKQTPRTLKLSASEILNHGKDLLEKKDRGALLNHIVNLKAIYDTKNFIELGITQEQQKLLTTQLIVCDKLYTKLNGLTFEEKKSVASQIEYGGTPRQERTH